MADLGELADLPGIPAAARTLWRNLISQELAPVPTLFAELRAYQQAIARSAQWSDEVDPMLARAIANGCMKLLSSVQDSTPEMERRAIQAAVRYFVLEDDAEADLDSVIGLDDDADVLNAVLTFVGREQWLVKKR